MFRKYFKRKNFKIGIILLALTFLPALISFVYTPFDPNAMDPNSMNLAPCLEHIFGTDNFGRDILSRVMEGTGTTFLVGIFTVLIGLVFGLVIGALTGYYGGIIDEALMRLNDCLASFPSILLSLIIVSLVGPGKMNVLLALGILFIPTFTRVVRSEVITKKELDYVKNAKLLGASDFRIIFLHIIPNTKEILLSSITISFNSAILAEASLSYLGLGVQPPDASLGSMLSDAQSYMLTSPWYVFTPGIVIILIALSVSLISQSFEEGDFSSIKKRNRILRSLGLLPSKNITRKSIESEKNDANKEETSNSQSENISMNKTTSEVLLKVKDLEVGFINEEEELTMLLRGINFDVKKGEVLGIVGESGSGKSLSAFAIMDILKEQLLKFNGQIIFENINLEKLLDEERRKIVGRDISMVFQEPMTSLNPVYTIGKQVSEMLEIHENIKDKERVLEALSQMGLENVEDLYNKYPHELSGGMRQRVMIAMALICKPKLLIADEITTALDVTSQAKILRLLKKINEESGVTIVMISHDLNVVKSICDRVIIIDKGKVVRTGTTEEIVSSIKSNNGKKTDKEEKSESIINSLSELEGKAKKVDTTSFASESDGKAKKVDAISSIKESATNKIISETHDESKKSIDEIEKSNKKNDEILVDIKDLNLYYKEDAKTWFGKKMMHQVAKNFNLEIKRGEIFGIVGESGSGKSSLVKAIAGMNIITEGKLKIADYIEPQMVFQDPYGSLNPSMSVGRILEEPLRINKKKRLVHDDPSLTKRQKHEAIISAQKKKGGKKEITITRYTKEERHYRVEKILRKVDLPAEFANRNISELSGGQRQRVAIALALICKKSLIILDEPVSALDIAIQKQILELLLRLHREYDLTYIFVSHDIGLVKRICDRVCVIKQSEIVEQGIASEVFTNPQHEYTKELISSSLNLAN